MPSASFQRRRPRTQEMCWLLLGLSLSSMAGSGCVPNTKIGRSEAHSASADAVTIGTKAEIDLKLIAPVEASDVEFQLANRSAEEIRIDSVKASCGCLRIDDYPERLEPGEQGKVTLSVDSRRQPGRFVQNLLIRGQTPSGHPRETWVELKGFVQGVIVERPHVRMGIAAKGRHITISGVLVGHSGTVQIAPPPSKAFDVVSTSIDPAEGSPFRPFHIRLVVKATEEAQSIHERLNVRVVTSTTTYETPVVVSGLIGGAIRVVPSALVFNLSSASRQKDCKTLTVGMLEGQATPRNVQLEFDRNLLHAAIEMQTPQEIRYSISVYRLAASEPYSGEIEVRDGDRLMSRVPVVVIP